MNTKLGQWMIAYGVFLVAMGAAGYLSNPEKAATALMSGGIFGALSMLWGWLISRGMGWARWAAATTTTLLVIVFAWRASMSWKAFAGGATEKLVPAVLITLMGVASLAMVTALFRNVLRRQSAAQGTP